MHKRVEIVRGVHILGDAGAMDGLECQSGIQRGTAVTGVAASAVVVGHRAWRRDQQCIGSLLTSVRPEHDVSGRGMGDQGMKVIGVESGQVATERQHRLCPLGAGQGTGLLQGRVEAPGWVFAQGLHAMGLCQRQHFITAADHDAVSRCQYLTRDFKGMQAKVPVQRVPLRGRKPG